MKFTKMHGCGNDYIYVNLFSGIEKIENFEETSKKVSDRHFGIGSDGLIVIDKSDKADFLMRIFNSDGSEAQMCGNGIRCVAKYVYDNKLTDKKEITVETKAGVKTLALTVENDKVVSVTVNMGEPITAPSLIPVKCDGDKMVSVPVKVGTTEYKLTSVSMGNPHTIVFVDDVKGINLEKIGPFFEHHEIFPERVNTEFVHVISRNEIDMRVWERGAGETLACGTGACASVMACILNGFTDHDVTVHLIGGDLQIRYDASVNNVFMTGPATVICTGEIEI